MQTDRVLVLDSGKMAVRLNYEFSLENLMINAVKFIFSKILIIYLIQIVHSIFFFINFEIFLKSSEIS